MFHGSLHTAGRMTHPHETIWRVSDGGFLRVEANDCPMSSAASPPATRSLQAALRGRDGLVHCLVDAEDLRQPGDPEDLQDPLLRADQIQRAVAGPHPL